MFRNKYLDYSEIVRQVEAWARDHAPLVRVTSLGASAEGRAIPLITIGRNPDEARPAVWIDGNMHASELCGSSVALAKTEHMIEIHKSRTNAATIPGNMPQTIKEPQFYIIPHMPT